MPRNSDPKIAVSTGVSADLFVKAEAFALENGFIRGEKPNMSGLLLVALADKVGFDLPAEEKAAVTAQTVEQKREAARQAEQARRDLARKRVEALRAAQHRPTPASTKAS